MATSPPRHDSLGKLCGVQNTQPMTSDHHDSEQEGRTNTASIEKSNPQENQQPVVRYRNTPIWLVSVYLAILILPWVLTCILDERPLTSSTYYDQRGRVDSTQYLSFWGLLSFINALNSISGILTVPITTTVLAYAAVTYSQKREDGQKLSITQLFALSDRGWTDVKILWHSRREGRWSRLLWTGALLVVIGAVQQPLQSALVTIEPIIAMSCGDVPVGGSCGTQAITVGYDAEPWAMALIDHRLVIQDVSSTLVTLDNTQSQENLWLDNPHAMGIRTQWEDPSIHSWLLNYQLDDRSKPLYRSRPSYFVSSLINGTATGVLREHALRLNSSVSCQNVTRSEFPTQCAGLRPLDLKISRQNLNISICVPGEVGKRPWTLSRNRQTIKEEIFIDFQFENPPLIGAGLALKDFTMHCEASTSRGYFELGNIMNDYVYGPLLDEWPDEETIEYDSNDYTASGLRPLEMDVNEDNWERLEFGHPSIDTFGVENMSVSGPLMMAASALFGNTSSLQLLYNESSTTAPIDILRNMCTRGNLPFSQLTGIAIFSESPLDPCFDIENRALDDEHANWEIDGLAGSFINKFGFPEDAVNLVDMSMFVVNRAVLQKTVAGTGPLYVRRIYTSPGTLFAKPKKSLASTIVISIFIAAQAAGLIAAVWYSRTAPTWTATMDSMAVARIGKAIDGDDMPPLGPVGDGDREKLQKVNALVGIVNHDRAVVERPSIEQGRGLIPEDLADMSDNGYERLKLALGAPGRIERSHAPVKERKKKFWQRGEGEV